jgi:hypothetical protein
LALRLQGTQEDPTPRHSNRQRSRHTYTSLYLASCIFSNFSLLG